MKYAALILYNKMNSLSAVDYLPVMDALLAGGIFLDETVILPYDAPMSVTAALTRLGGECDGVFVICDGSLLYSAKSAVTYAAGPAFTEDHLLKTPDCLYAVLPTGEAGAQIAAAETVPAVDARRGKRYLRSYLRTVGAPADKMQAALQKAEEIAAGKLILHTSEKYGCGRIELIYDQDTPKMTADEVERTLAEELREYVYAVSDDSIAKRLVDVLKLHRLRISTAESFTGGGIGREIVRIPGASEVFYEGINAYDGAAKIGRLSVSEFTLKSKGAVSDEVAYEMAAGLIQQGHCDISIATTGYAGPQADNRPVGLCFIAIGTKENVYIHRRQLAGDREQITETAIRLALFWAYKALTGSPLDR